MYLVDQFPSTAFRLKDIRHHFISGVFELIICAVTSPTTIGLTLVSGIIVGSSLASAKRWQVVLGLEFPETVCEFLDLTLSISLVALVVQRRREIVQFECKSDALVHNCEIERPFL